MPKRTDGWIPKEKRETLTCKECDEELPITSFTRRGRNKRGLIQFDSRCKLCSKKHQKNHWNSVTSLKQSKLDYLLEIKKRCSRCGYSDCPAALDFHHMNGEEKDTGVSDIVHSRSGSLEDLKKEISKCVVLCCRCHREFHAGLWCFEQ